MRRTALVIAAALLLWSCSKPAVEEVDTKAAAPVTTVALAPQTLEGVVSATGVVTAAPGADWMITAPEHGRIADMPKSEGDRVQPGDLLVRFDIPSLQTDVLDATRARWRPRNHTSRTRRRRWLRLTTLVDRHRCRGAEGARRRAARSRRRKGRGYMPLSCRPALQNATEVAASDGSARDLPGRRRQTRAQSGRHRRRLHDRRHPPRHRSEQAAGRGLGRHRRFLGARAGRPAWCASPCRAPTIPNRARC